MKLAATICLVESISQGRGPWIFWHDLENGCAEAAKLGFDGIELFSATPDQTPASELRATLDRHGLELAAVGTGAGKLLEKLELASPDSDVRARARAFVTGFVELGAEFGAPAIVGSMQGTLAGGGSRDHLRDAMAALGKRAKELGTFVLLEPVNRYEGDFFSGLGDARAFVEDLDGVMLLADLFHMNIEEASIADSLRKFGDRVGHVHFADSNRQAPGLGHTDFHAIAKSLHAVSYERYVSAEALPVPDPNTAAAQIAQTFEEAGFRS